jgi:nucleotide-binding universal stress UspA family protein
MSVLPPAKHKGELEDRAQRFLSGGVRTLDLLKVPAETVIRSGAVREEIGAQMQAGDHDLLVLGAPLAERRHKVVLEGVVAQVVREWKNTPS